MTPEEIRIQDLKKKTHLRALVDKAELVKKVADWLDEVKLNESEELTCHANENEIYIKVWDSKNLECRTDARTKMERDRRHRLLIKNRTGKKI